MCKRNCICQVWDDDALHYVTYAQHLNHGKLIKQDNWAEWKASEHTQLEQYNTKGMFGAPY
jgi:hypothetical protein